MVALLILALACTTTKRPPREPFDAQGHRGARGLLPENTLPAFRRALELGVSTLELDIGVTADGVVVVSHDRRLSSQHLPRPRRASRLPEAGGPLMRDLTLAEVRRYDCGSLNPSRRRFPEPPRRNLPGTPIPTLAEVFDLAAGLDPGARFNIEMKVDPTVDETVPLEEFVARLVDLVDAARARRSRHRPVLRLARPRAGQGAAARADHGRAAVSRHPGRRRPLPVAQRAVARRGRRHRRGAGRGRPRLRRRLVALLAPGHAGRLGLSRQHRGADPGGRLPGDALDGQPCPRGWRSCWTWASTG